MFYAKVEIFSYPIGEGTTIELPSTDIFADLEFMGALSEHDVAMVGFESNIPGLDHGNYKTIVQLNNAVKTTLLLTEPEIKRIAKLMAQKQKHYDEIVYGLLMGEIV